MGLSLVDFVGLIPIVSEVSACEVGRGRSVLDTVYVGHGDKIKVDLPLE